MQVLTLHILTVWWSAVDYGGEERKTNTHLCMYLNRPTCSLYYDIVQMIEESAECFYPLIVFLSEFI